MGCFQVFKGILWSIFKLFAIAFCVLPGPGLFLANMVKSIMLITSCLSERDCPFPDFDYSGNPDPPTSLVFLFFLTIPIITVGIDIAISMHLCLGGRTQIPLSQRFLDLYQILLYRSAIHKHLLLLGAYHGQ